MMFGTMSSSSSPSLAGGEVVNHTKLKELKQHEILQTLDKLSSESSGLLMFVDQWKDLEQQFDSVKGVLQQRTDEVELKWELMVWKQKYIEQKAKEVKTRETRLEEERRCRDARRMEIDVNHQLVEKCYELVKERDMVLDEKLEKVWEKMQQLDETEAELAKKMSRVNKRERKLDAKQKSLEISNKELAKRLEELRLKEMRFVAEVNEFESRKKGLEGKMQGIELKEERLKGSNANAGVLVHEDKAPGRLPSASSEVEGEVIADMSHPPLPTDPITIIIEEKIDVGFTCWGALYYFRAEGRLSVRVLEEKDAYIQIQVDTGDNPGFSFTTHPWINKALFASDNILGVKDSKESFPISPSEDGIVLLCWDVDIKDESALPLKINYCPSVSANESCISIEYDASSAFELQNVVISVPLPKLREIPNVRQIDGEWRYDSGESNLEWLIGVIGDSNRSGSMEFVIPPVKYTSEFSPISVQFSATSTCSGLKVANVLPMKPGPHLKYTQRALLQTESYEVG